MAKIVTAGAFGTAHAGHGTLFDYDKADPAALQLAEKEFNELMIGGKPVAFVVADEGGRKVGTKRIESFDPNADEILIMFPMAGG